MWTKLPDTDRTQAKRRTQPDTTNIGHNCAFWLHSTAGALRTGGEQARHNEQPGHNEHWTERTTGH
eukprot:1977879-Alexandrium_andersonii.AAC.1